jgi:hypothetical protein
MDPTQPVLIGDHNVDDGDDDDEYLPRPAARRRVPPLTAALLIAIMATAAFFAGVEVQKQAGKVKSTNANAALATAGATGAATGANGLGGGGSGGFGGFGGGGGTRGGRTAGLVTNVQPGVISVSDAQGNVVKIITSGNPTVNKTTPGTLSDIQIGSSIVVQGQPASDGSVKATSITLGAIPATPGG